MSRPEDRPIEYYRKWADRANAQKVGRAAHGHVYTAEEIRRIQIEGEMIDSVEELMGQPIPETEDEEYS